MTKALYLTDAYQKTCTATVVSVEPDDNAVILDKTVFYPGGGGQLPDTGQLIAEEAGYTVIQAKRKGNQILHIIEAGDGLPEEGTTVTVEIDWDRRYKAMRTHTAMHILCGVIWRDYEKSVTGGNMDLLSGRMDFEFDELDRDTIDDIETAINEEVANARDVEVDILPREEAFQIPDLIRTKINLLPDHIKEVRTIEIKGLDLQADGGTHVSNTEEVGHIRITGYKSKGADNKRLYIELDEE